MNKEFKKKKEEIKQLIDPMGGCIASDKIIAEGKKVGYMYRDKPHNKQDSGWRFLSGDESPEYMNNLENHRIYAVNTICNFDPDIIPFVKSRFGAAYERISDLHPFKKAPRREVYFNPDYPVVENRVQIFNRWEIKIYEKFNKRIEDKTIVLWKPNITIMIDHWKPKVSKKQIISQLKERILDNAYEIEEIKFKNFINLGYRINEERPEGLVYIYNVHLVDKGTELLFTFYFDYDNDFEFLKKIARSIKNIS
ncbi:MAG: DUF2185 domain-containing protein [Candidatus Lokiarchaeota archaeon]|nr:DUF2185 domain-containing protein [Candidatus Lokiarchaeota archaeon]